VTLGQTLPLLLLLVAMYFLLLRPARARQAQQRATLASLEPGRKVMTTAGLFGRITSIEDGEVELEIAPGVVVRYVAAAIARIVPEPEAEGTSPGAQPSILGDDTPPA